jgi:hypothetical protein
MFKYRKFTGKKEVTTFVWRDSLPTEPIAGTFYWVDDENGTALYFANYDSELLRLDNKNISEIDLSDELRKKINGLIEEDNQIKNTIEENEKATSSALNDLNERINQAENTIEEDEEVVAASLNDLNDKIGSVSGELTDKINNIGEDNLIEELKKKINNITIDEPNNLMTINIDDKKYYSTIFAGVSSPTIPAQSSEEITTSDTKSIPITQNDTGVTTKWFVSTSEITTNDFSSWNTGTSASISGISSSLYTTYYVYAVNIKNGINSDVSSSIYKFKRQQIAPTYNVSGNNYSTSRTCKINEKSGFVLKYSSDKSNWKSDLTSAIGVSLDGFKSNKEKTYTFYVKYLNEKTSEDSVVQKITITVGSPQIEYKSLADIPASVSDFSGWKAFGLQTMTRDMKFNETFDYYPCFAVPSNKTLVATALGKEITPKETIKLTIPSGGNAYVIYVLPKQSANVDAEMNIKIS